MFINDMAIIKIMRILQKYKKRTIAAILGDIEQEFSHLDDVLYEVRRMKTILNNDGKIHPTEIQQFINILDTRLPTYYMTRKIILDNINDFVRKVLQQLLTDIEGYDN